MSQRSDIGPFSMVPHWLLRVGLSPAALAVWVVLASYANNEDVAWPSVKRIAEAAGVSERAVYNAIKELVEKAGVTVHTRLDDNGRQTSNAYFLRFLPLIVSTGAPAPHAPPGPHVVHPQDAPRADELNPDELDPKEATPAAAVRDFFTFPPGPYHAVAVQCMNAIRDVPAFFESSQGQHQALERLVAEYVGLAPSVNVLLAELTPFNTYYKGARSNRKSYRDGVACLRNWWKRDVGKWALQIERQGGRTAKTSGELGGASVSSQRDDLLRKAKALRGKHGDGRSDPDGVGEDAGGNEGRPAAHHARADRRLG